METNNNTIDKLHETTFEQEPSGPEGIGGWLILIVIGLIVTPFRLGYEVIMNMVPLISSPNILALNSPDLTNLIYFEIFGNLIFALYSILLLFLLFSKNKLFPKLLIFYFVTNFAFIMLDLFLASQISVIQHTETDASVIKEIFKSSFNLIIWVPYLILSKRVKNTFVN